MRTPKSQKYHAVGVDGCRAGWFAVEMNWNGEWACDIFSDIGEIWQRRSPASAPILIDIPIGLATDGARTCDVMARKVLKNRASSVFPVPCRKALAAMNYQDASQINFQETGKKLSVQTWNITARIREVDEFLIAVPQARGLIRESHPEVGFWALAGAQPMNFNKKTADGHWERKRVLTHHLPLCEDIIASARSNFTGKDLATDDILDALALAVTGLSPPQTIVSFPPNPPRDSRQLCMEIVYTNHLMNPP